MTCTTRCHRSLPDRFRSLKKTFKTKLNKSVITLQPLPFIKEKLVMLHTRLCILLFCRYQDHPPGFSWFSPRKSPQIGKMYEALTAMVFNQSL